MSPTHHQTAHLELSCRWHHVTQQWQQDFAAPADCHASEGGTDSAISAGDILPKTGGCTGVPGTLSIKRGGCVAAWSPLYVWMASSEEAIWNGAGSSTLFVLLIWPQSSARSDSCVRMVSSCCCCSAHSSCCSSVSLLDCVLLLGLLWLLQTGLESNDWVSCRPSSELTCSNSSS